MSGRGCGVTTGKEDEARRASLSWAVLFPIKCDVLDTSIETKTGTAEKLGVEITSHFLDNQEALNKMRLKY